MTQASGDTIQLMEDAVQHLLPPYATEDDMYEALDRCGMTEAEIYAEIERRLPGNRSVPELANAIQHLLFESFEEAIAGVTDHKAPLYAD